MPLIGETCFIYLIDIKLIRPANEEENYKKRKIFDPSQKGCAFGFLSRNKLPPVCIL